MAIFHLHVKNISRGDGRSVVAAAAYRAGETLQNEAEERASAFGGRRDVLHAEIRLPPGAPEWMAERERLWNAVERAEVRKDARLAKEIEMALPRELPRATWLELVRTFADAYVSLGFVVDLAIHDDGTAHNPHSHLLLTTRVLAGEGFGPKVRAADGKAFVLEARKLWATLTNGMFAKKGFALTIDYRSHAENGVAEEPGRHRGPDPAARRARRRNMPGADREALKHELLPDEILPERRSRTTIRVDGEEREVDRDMDRVWGQGTWVTDEVPVPDPEGNIIPYRVLEQAQTSMLTDMERDAKDELWFRRGTATAATPEPDRAPQAHWFSRRRDRAPDEPDGQRDRQRKQERERE